MTSSLELLDIDYSYGHRSVFRQFSISFGKGITGVIGPNGAGKTTLWRLTAGIEKPRSGLVHSRRLGRVKSHLQRSNLRRLVGFMPQNVRWFRDNTVEEFVAYCLQMRGFTKADRDNLVEIALSATNVVKLKKRPLGELSGGERQRAFLAATIVHQPEILILDEPTAGLDPHERIRFRKLLRKLSEKRSILLSTHLIEDLGFTTDRIIVLNQGAVVWDGTPTALSDRGNASQERTALESGYMSVLNNETA